MWYLFCYFFYTIFVYYPTFTFQALIHNIIHSVELFLKVRWKSFSSSLTYFTLNLVFQSFTPFSSLYPTSSTSKLLHCYLVLPTSIFLYLTKVFFFLTFLLFLHQYFFSYVLYRVSVKGLYNVLSHVLQIKIWRLTLIEKCLVFPLNII